MTDMKERILEAAHEILSREGGAALTTRRECEAVGVTMPTLYHYFANRDELVSAVYELALQRFMATKRNLKLTDEPLVDLRKSCELVLDFVAKNKNVAIAVLARGLEEPAIFASSYELLRERVRRAADAGCLNTSEREAAAMCWSVVQGLVLSMVAAPDGAVNITSLRRRLLDGLMASL